MPAAIAAGSDEASCPAIAPAASAPANSITSSPPAGSTASIAISANTPARPRSAIHCVTLRRHRATRAVGCSATAPSVRMRMSGTFQSASNAIAGDILECPCSRSRNTIGISAISSPARAAW